MDLLKEDLDRLLSYNTKMEVRGLECRIPTRGAWTGAGSRLQKVPTLLLPRQEEKWPV